MKVVIIGAGVAGLSIGWRLSQAGVEVTVLERAQPGQGASWAAAGMLAVTAELEDAAEPERRLALDASSLWPAFAAELEQAAERPIGFRRDGALLLAGDGAALEVMRARAAADPKLALLDAGQARAKVPLLAQTALGGLWSGDEAHVDNRALSVALAVAFIKAGGALVANEAAVRIEKRGGRAAGVLTPYNQYDAGAVLVAAGAWSGLLDDIPVAPVKGEVVALAPPPGARLPGAVVWGNHVYCVPRHGRLLVGATMQETGFDTSLTDTAKDDLQARAAGLMPALADWTVADHWAGLRPKAPDGLPLLGATATPNLFVAGGQFRNGILFTPAIAQKMADLLLGRGTVDPAFDPQRFSGK